MHIKSDHGVFPDYLSLTYSVDSFPEVGIVGLLVEMGFVGDSACKDMFVPGSGSGAVRFHRKKRFISVTFSGGALHPFTKNGNVAHLLQELTGAPYRVTRLDLAKDVDFAKVSSVRHRLKRIWSNARLGKVRLGRKAVPSSKAYRVQSVRDDSEITGTVYCGSRKDRYFARVYDKRAEGINHTGLDIGVERLRYEVCAMRGTASLRDFLEPDALFFYLAAPDLLRKPSDVAEWVTSSDNNLTLPEMVGRTEFERAVSLIDRSGDLEIIALFLQESPSSYPLIMRKIGRKLGNVAGYLTN